MPMQEQKQKQYSSSLNSAKIIYYIEINGFWSRHL